MADLQQVVGAILRDLAKARFGSDLYSRSIARYYENDYLLRRFPVPRADVEEVELDLKFSVGEILSSDVNTEGREANVAFVLERTVERLVATFLHLMRTDLDREDHTETASALRDMLTQRVDSATVRIELRQRGLRYFIESYNYLIGATGEFDASRVLDELRQPFLWAIAEYRLDGVTVAQLRERLDPVITRAFEHEDLGKVVRSLAEPIKQIWTTICDSRLDVEVRGHKLAEIPEGAISTIKVKATVRNLVWTEVKVDEGKYRHALTSD